jgi:hypothetical protein
MNRIYGFETDYFLYHCISLACVIISEKKHVLPSFDTISKPFAASRTLNLILPRRYETQETFTLTLNIEMSKYYQEV